MTGQQLLQRRTASRPAAQPNRRVLRRPEHGRVIAGVCAGLAAYFGWPVWAVRVVTVLLGLVGIGVVLYLFWWATIPTGDPDQASDAARPALFARLAPRLELYSHVQRFMRREVVIGSLLLALAGFGLAIRSGWAWRESWIPPAVLMLGGLCLAWSQADTAGQIGDGAGEAARSSTAARVLAGLAALVVGVLMILRQQAPNWALIQSGLAALAVLLVVGLVMAPWWLRLGQALSDERAARVRAAERADIAAHLHDSVLQTLALIRANAVDADLVARLARAQERELRQWLYADREVPGTSLATELKELVAQVEDGKIGKTGAAPATAIDVVIVGDCAPSDRTEALLQATREALVNAVAHGSPPVSVYLEVSEDAVEVYVRDRGAGFDPATIAADRFGVRESIIGRLERRGGSAEVVSRPDWGTEVRMRLPR